MVSFSCEACGDVLTKKKLDPHRNRCHGASFTCIDCMVHFAGTEYRAHTSCMTEEQKYHGSLYKNKNKKPRTSGPTAEASMSTAMAHPAYVEDVVDDADEWRDYGEESDYDRRFSGNRPPSAPTPPQAVEGHVNVFDFLVGNPTPTASNIDLPQTIAVPPPPPPNEETQLVRFDSESHALVGHEDEFAEDTALVEYGTGPVPAANYQTPAPKAERRRKDGEKEIKKDKKRKRLHIETDHPMTDAPPVLHSGLTGGMKGLMARPHAFPPSPDYSGADMADTPASPLKKTRHAKHHKQTRGDGFGNIMAMITAGASSKPKTKKRKHVSTSTAAKKTTATTTHHHRHRIEAPKEQKLLEYRPGSKDGKDSKDAEAGQMILYKPPAEHFLSFVTKGPDSERGYSMNKALKRYHRERSASGSSRAKLVEEKELWRSLRLRKNERGEIVLFSV